MQELFLGDLVSSSDISVGCKLDCLLWHISFTSDLKNKNTLPFSLNFMAFLFATFAVSINL
jgi:hypothetical protein